MLKGISWTSLLLVGATGAVGLMAGCGDDDDTTAASGPTGASSSSTSDASSSSSSGMGGMGQGGGTGGMGQGGGTGGMGQGGGGPDFTPLASGNVLVNGGFENFSAGANPPFDPPDDWVSFGFNIATLAGVGYDQFATQGNGDPIFPTQDPFPGLMNSRALKVFGRSADNMMGMLFQTLGTVFQEYTAGNSNLPPAGSKLRLTGWGYHASQDPLGTESQAYLVIKCFNQDFSQELCGPGGSKSALITSTTAANGWVQYIAEVDSFDANAAVLQAGVEFEQCLNGGLCSGPPSAGAVFFDDLVFSYE